MAEVDLDVLPSEETQESAKEFINRLGDNGLENMKGEMRQMFKASLKADYDELYGKPEHFLQELLQNADDVEYKDPDSEPKFSITTQHPFDTVRFYSNETGFTRKDVRAVCRSRMGTKAGQTATTGEKGIGFKSVFAIAETASIASGPYRFKLDRSQEFGTICPKVWDVPGNITVEKTGSTLVLEIDKTGKVRDEVCDIIRHFDPDTILFLRKLKLVEIKTYQYVEPDIFRREEFRAEDGTTHVIIRENGKCKSCFKIFESPIRNLTPRPKYPNVQDSTIKLAFPVDAKFEHAIEFPNAQQVYTFLPIADYGLGFTIQGEFVLTSSREDIQPRVAWNDELLEAIPGVFSDAIKVLNQSNLRFSWPIFLSIYEPKGFFKDVRKKIKSKLDEEEILQVEDETKPLAKPSTVVIVPDELKLQGVPLIRSKAALSRYLSHRYSPDCISYLKLAMKMKELSTDGFLEDLKEYVECVDDESISSGTPSGDEGYVPFRAQSTEWHSCVASILMKYTWQSIVQQMKMIPLSDGKTWTAATPENKGKIFFLSQENQKQDILDGINVRFVHPDITKPEENQRFQLFQALGVDKFEASKLCKRIEAAHGNVSGTFTSTLGEQSLVKVLISHALFLFRNGHNPSVDLWVATEAGKESRASATYFRDIERKVVGWQCPVLHRDYYACAKDEEKDRWMKWLDMELHIRKYPRLVDSFPRPESFLPSDFNIAEEMELILNDRTNWTPYGILKLLQRHWDTGHWAKYSQWLKEGDAKWSSTSVSKLRDRISELQVTCLGPQGRVVHCLKGTILPSAGLEGAYEGAPLFILDVYGDGGDDVERVEGRDWYFLQHLGVKLNPDLDDCISCLRTSRDKADPRKREALSYIRIIYDRISQICHESPENNEKVKSAFNSDGLVYIPQYSSSYRIPWPVNSSWVSARNCVWKGAKYASRLKNHSVLSHHYARHERLFLDIVRVQFTVEISDVLSEIESNAVLYGSTELYCILRELSEFIRENPDASSYKSKQSGSSFRSVLSRHRIFPISQPGSTSIINDTCAATSQWFIPDHQAFYSLFSEKIPLMVIDPEKLIDISHLLQYLGCNQRRLSSQARAYPTNPDKVRYARNYSARLQEKAKYIQSLVPDSLPYRRPSLKAVDIAVHKVDSDTVTVEWEIESDGLTYKSSVYESQIVVMLYGKVLTIYMPAKYLQQNALPPLDLSYDLATLLGIPAEYSAFVEQILTRVWDSDTAEIEKALSKRGFQFDSFKEDEVQEDVSIEEPSVIETTENNQAPPNGLDDVKDEPQLAKEEASQLAENVTSNVADQQVAGVSITKDETDDKDEKREKTWTKVFSVDFDFPVTSNSTIGTITDEALPPDPESAPEDPSDEEEDKNGVHHLSQIYDQVLSDSYSNLVQFSSSTSVKEESSQDHGEAEETDSSTDTSVPFISEEQLLYFRPRLSSPTPSDNGDSDDSDYSSDDSDPPLPGAQPGSKRHEVKIIDNDPNTSKSKLSVSTAKKGDQTQIPTTPKRTPAPSKPPHTQPPREVSLRQLQQFISPLRNTTQNKRLDEQYNVTRRLQNTGLFRLSGPTSIVYVSNPDDLPPMESRNNDTQVLATLQARMQIFKDDNRSVFALIPTIAQDGDTELAFLGQAWVSQMLINCLGSGYRPQRDWRSPLRTGLGYDDVTEPIDDSEAPFRIEGDTSALSQFLFEQGYEPAGRWVRSLPGVRTYYIDVQTTPDSRTTPFTMTPGRLEKIRQCRVPRGAEAPEKVYILIRLSSVHPRHPSVTPTASFYVDPWAFYTEGLMHVKFSNDLFSVRISRDARPHFTMKSPERDLDDSTPAPDIIDRVVRYFSSNRTQERPRPSQSSNVNRLRLYKYDSLRRADKIRLLALRPGKGATSLRGEVEIHRLQENSKPPEYVCVSYVWGSSLKQFRLYTSEGVLMLTASLYLALLHLRDTKKTVYLWADAICIDQEDSPDRRNEEKEHQIRMLPRIFRCAKIVFAWLGIEENGSRKVMRKFEDWGTKIIRGKHKDLEDKIEVTDPIWVSISRLLNRRWFTRIWIVQEVVLANELVVVCGKHRLSWDTFYAAAQHCLTQNEYDRKIDIATLDTAKNIIDLGKLRDNFQKNEKFRSKQTVFTLLNRCYQKDATVPRDRIFALLSMATDKDEMGFEPNYQASSFDIIQKFASTFVKQGYALDLLYRTRPETRLIEEQGSRGKTEATLPSWVPNLTANHYPSSLSSWSGNYHAGIRDASKISLTNLGRVEGQALVLRGYVACKIGNKGENHSMLDDVMAYLGEIFSTIDKLYDRRKTARDIEEIKWKTAIGDATSLVNEVGGSEKRGEGDADSASPRPHSPEKTRKIQQHRQQKFEAQAISAYGALVGYLASERPHSTWKNQKSRFEYAMKGQKIFDANRDAWERLLPYVYKAIAFAEVFAPQRVVVCDTDKGDVGIVPAIAEKGDVVVLFPGAKVPFILRKRGNQEYELIGECYIHGIMRGEGLPVGNEVEQVFRLV